MQLFLSPLLLTFWKHKGRANTETPIILLAKFTICGKNKMGLLAIFFKNYILDKLTHILKSKL